MDQKFKSKFTDICLMSIVSGMTLFLLSAIGIGIFKLFQVVL